MIASGVVIQVKVIPGSKITEIKSTEAGVLKISLNAQPEKGKANKELIDFLADFLNMRKSDIEIIKGETSRIKQVLIKNINKQILVNKLGG